MRVAPDDRLHLWFAQVPSRLPDEWAAANEVILSTGERARYARYIRDSDRELFLVAHVLMRTTLSRYADIAPQDWTFETDEHGRPEITNARAPEGLRCNLSHTDGLVALVVHDAADAGIDVERVGAVADMHSVARTVFADGELAQFATLPADARPVRFTTLWTLKEAFIKAKGMGLALPLKDFSFAVGDDSAISFACKPSVDPSPEAWSFTVGRPTPDHVMSTACRSRAGEPPRQVDAVDLTNEPPFLFSTLVG